MAKPHVIDRKVIGFEKIVRSLTEGAEELVKLWPDSSLMLRTPLGQAAFRWSVSEGGDKELEDTFAMLRASEANGGPKLDFAQEVPGLTGGNGPSPLARVFASKGRVCLISWLGTNCGWEPLKRGGFRLFVETWGGRSFRERTFTEDEMILLRPAWLVPFDKFPADVRAVLEDGGMTEERWKGMEVAQKYKDLKELFELHMIKLKENGSLDLGYQLGTQSNIHRLAAEHGWMKLFEVSGTRHPRRGGDVSDLENTMDGARIAEASRQSEEKGTTHTGMGDLFLEAAH
jgi:hypothetical protein